MPTIPTGTITFLFTDIEGSTRLWEQYPAQMQLALARHDALLRQAIEQNSGYVFKTVGDAFCAAFSTAKNALLATIHIQTALVAEPWPVEIRQIRVRMGLHTGVAEEREGDYFGQTLNRVARLQAVAYGGQILVSTVTRELVANLLPEGCYLLDLGEHRLKDLANPEQIFQLAIPGLPSEFPPLKTSNTYPNNLPPSTTSFIGREIEIAKIKALLITSRLVTLTGAGGIGKTRLSQTVAQELLTTFKDGIWLVELAPLADPALVVQAVAHALKLSEKPGQLLLTTLLERLKTNNILLLLDNCEHLIESCARLVTELLADCPNLKILTTSREGLNVRGERLYRVPSLGVPPAGNQTQPLNTIENLTRYEAVRLFIERAQAVNSQFQLTEKNSKTVAEICRRLDGIPLALELAAVRVKALSVEQIAKRLIDRFRLLTGGNRTDLPRQQTLRALIDWSYDLLDEKEQVLWQRLSIFAGGWTLEAAEKVCTGEPIEEWEVLDLLTQLVEKSLVVTEGENVATRYRMLETIREYGQQKLAEKGILPDLKLRFASYFLNFVESITIKFVSSGEIESYEQIERELDNVRVAIEFSIEQKNLEISLRFGIALGYFWEVRSYFEEGGDYLARIFALPDSLTSPLRGTTLNFAGVLARRKGDFELANNYFQESLDLFLRLGNKEGIARALNSLGIVADIQRNYEKAREYHRGSLTLKRELGNPREMALSLNNLGLVEFDLGDYQLALEHLEECLTICQELGEKVGSGHSLINISHIAVKKGDLEKAQKYLEESLKVFYEADYKINIAGNLASLANLASIKWSQSVNSNAQLKAVPYLTYAARLCGVVSSLISSIGGELDHPEGDFYQNSLNLSRSELKEEAFQVAFAEGQTMSLEKAIDYALHIPVI